MSVQPLAPLASVVRFVELLLKFQGQVRTVSVPDRNHDENNSEHSFQLAMVAWYLAATAGLKLDLERLVLYALAHDLPEAYCGDTSLYHADYATKKQREAMALAEIEHDFAEFPEMITACRDYEQQADEESRLVYALDKFMPTLMITLSGGGTWHEYNRTTLAWLREVKLPKTQSSPLVHQLMVQLFAELELRPELFAAAADQVAALAAG